MSKVKLPILPTTVRSPCPSGRQSHSGQASNPSVVIAVAGCVTSGTGCLARAPGPPCRAGQCAAGCVTSASTAGPGRARPLRWAPCHLRHQMLLGPNISLPSVPNLVINRGASAQDGAGGPARWQARPRGPRGGAQGRAQAHGTSLYYVQCIASPCLVCRTIYFLNFFLFRAFHSPSCVARLLKSCFTFRFLSASLKEKEKKPFLH